MRQRTSALASTTMGAASALVLATATAVAQAPTSASFTAREFAWEVTGTSQTSVTVALGAKVTFAYPSGGNAHNARFSRSGVRCTQTAGTGTATNATVVPTSAEGPGWSADCTFDEPGDYTFLCVPHSGSMRGTVSVVAPSAPTPAPPPAAPGPAPAPPVDAPRLFASKLEVSRAGVSPARRTLDVLAPITARASGRVAVAFEAGGRTTRFTQAIDTANRRLRFTRTLSTQQARGGTGIMTLAYPGNASTRPQTVRLRAASGRAALDPTRPRLDGRRLRASGSISDRARGVVRVQLDWVGAGGPESVELSARIDDGRWRLDREIPAGAAQSIAARRSSLHSYVLFTGYLPARMRGEMRSYELAP